MIKELIYTAIAALILIFLSLYININFIQDPSYKVENTQQYADRVTKVTTETNVLSSTLTMKTGQERETVQCQILKNRYALLKLADNNLNLVEAQKDLPSFKKEVENLIIEHTKQKLKCNT